MPKLDLNKINPVALAVLTFAVLGIAILLGKLVFPVLQTTQTPATQATDIGPQLSVISVLNSQKGSFGGYALELPAGWNISYELSSSTNTQWVCHLNQECHLMLITHDTPDAKLKQVVLSTPIGVSYDWRGTSTTSQVTGSFSGADVKFTLENYQTATADGSVISQPDLNLQIYGCNSAYLCIDAGPFDPSPDLNKAQMAEFQAFAQQLKVSKV